MDSEVSELLPRSLGVTLICLLPQQKATGVWLFNSHKDGKKMSKIPTGEGLTLVAKSAA